MRAVRFRTKLPLELEVGAVHHLYRERDRYAIRKFHRDGMIFCLQDFAIKGLKVGLGPFGKISFFRGGETGVGWRRGLNGLAEDDFGLAAAKTQPILPFAEFPFDAGRADFELVGAREGSSTSRMSETSREPVRNRRGNTFLVRAAGGRYRCEAVVAAGAFEFHLDNFYACGAAAASAMAVTRAMISSRESVA